jgi:hypothetical protein
MPNTLGAEVFDYMLEEIKKQNGQSYEQPCLGSVESLLVLSLSDYEYFYSWLEEKPKYGEPFTLAGFRMIQTPLFELGEDI